MLQSLQKYVKPVERQSEWQLEKQISQVDKRIQNVAEEKGIKWITKEEALLISVVDI
jgi:hypothetical protein